MKRVRFIFRSSNRAKPTSKRYDLYFGTKIPKVRTLDTVRLFGFCWYEYAVLAFPCCCTLTNNNSINQFAFGMMFLKTLVVSRVIRQSYRAGGVLAEKTKNDRVVKIACWRGPRVWLQYQQHSVPQGRACHPCHPLKPFLLHHSKGTRKEE